MFPQSSRVVPELARDDIRELIESPYRLIYRLRQKELRFFRSCIAGKNTRICQNKVRRAGAFTIHCSDRAA